MNKIRCLIIDDEPPAIELLERYVEMVDQLSIAGTCNSAIKAFNIIKDIQVDLVFLDIQMPILNGIDFIKTIKDPPEVILTTAHRDYALDGYDLNIIDYLLKPISFDRFLRAVDRYRSKSQLIIKKEISPKTKEHLFFNVNRMKHKVILSDIIYIESLKDYVRIYLPKSNLVVKGNIGSILKLLPPEDFVRIHRSFVIPIDKINTYQRGHLNIDGNSLPIGDKYRPDLEKRIK